MKRTVRWILFFFGLLLFGGVLLTAAMDAKPPANNRVVEGYQAWSQETLDLAESFPVQDGGRIKPLTTYAGFTMLRLHGARSLTVSATENGEPIRIQPLAWMLDIFFRPQLAMQEPTFRVDDSAVLTAIGVTPRDRRDHYSYQEIEPGRDRLFEMAQGYNNIPKKERTGLEQQVLDLAENYHSYEQLLGAFSMVRGGLRMMPVEGLPEAADDAPKVAGVAEVMATAPVIRQVLQESQAKGGKIPPHLSSLLQQLLDGANASNAGLFLFPPAGKDDEGWLSPGERVMNVMEMKTRDVEGSVKDIKAIETLSRSIFDSEEAFRTELAKLKADVVERAQERGEYEKIELEAEYYRKNWLLYALSFFLIATLLAMGMWMTAGRASQWLSWGVWGTTFVAWGMVIVPIVKRCLIMGRPPVGNLYDTIIFIAAAIVLFGSIAEAFMRRRLLLGAMPIACVLLILLARLFEVGDARDHMDPLVAVLRSNYWLTIHVITITLGYASGLVVAVIGIVYVLLRGLGLDGGDASMRRSLTRAAYGMVCVTLFLSLVGTVLGGIWANDSWGRFWGWDPKENGALMIVLANLAILHARLGGYIKEWGLHLSGIALSAVVTFSWWHVNMLDTGLHNYGFTKGASYIMLVYSVVGLLILFGLAMAWWDREKTAAARRGQQRETPELGGKRREA
ncbi:ABC-type transport system involved in cytochrome c biogenesis permease subunit [Haloferula luteola]|uniref:ABC-type transport system involved in cytochrome c biogenesis permease subunit n=1 Tax=Haloferula luteola TaxID=595692 RepID=A0A840V2J9_9BACT|nr:cytochrome c biogenesis protein CcsA [Haloferula luteola]MBB5352215.1 ABC-type transport system involved in cytochrome c biogenesis permease subunit [Haloferula luteola]